MSRRYLRWSILLIVLLMAAPSFGQYTDQIDSMELQDLVFLPTAGTLEQGQYSFEMRAYGEGGLLAGIRVGLFQRFMFGISYGGQRLLGNRDPIGNDLPGVMIRYRLIEESMVLPALTIGFNMQGHGPWYGDINRYQFKAPGAFAVLSRNWRSAFGRFGLHVGANYNTIEMEQEEGWDGWAGIDFSMNDQVVVTVEYDLARDDNEPGDGFGEGEHGYLNAGLRFAFAKSLAIQADFIDILGTSDQTTGIGRAIKLVYVETFTL